MTDGFILEYDINILKWNSWRS
eukprot:SAG31_NODE_41203_length_277_cov_0.601124_1_plen_21_part_01